MPYLHYTTEQLLHLRNSPLAQKPDSLPAIEQWIEYVYLEVDGERERLRIPHSESQTQRSRVQLRSTTGGASPMGNFSTGQQRPSLAGSRLASKDDVSLGPPRTIFASSRNTTRLSDFPDGASATESSDRAETRFPSQQTNRKGGQTNENENKNFRESWTTARERRVASTDEDATVDRSMRNGRRDRERDREQDGERRNGAGERFDTRWGAREERRPNGERDRRWRSRERPRQERDRVGQTDREPEWMEDVGDQTNNELESAMAMPKNQEEFEKWKQAQHARDKKPAAGEVSPPVESATIADTVEAAAMPAQAALQLDSSTNRTLHDWGKQPTGEAGTASVTAKPSNNKSKTSRFMPMFKKDEPRSEENVPVTQVQQISANFAQQSSEDKEGFQRILQMLGGSSLTSQPPTAAGEPTSPPAKSAATNRSKSRFTGFFDQGQKSPEIEQSGHAFTPSHHGTSSVSRVEAGQSVVDGGAARDVTRLMHQSGVGNATPKAPPGFQTPPQQEVVREQRIPSSLGQIAQQDLPQRTGLTPDVTIHNLLASQSTQRPLGHDKNSEFLLNLLQTKGSSRPASQHVRSESSFPLWLDQSAQSSDGTTMKSRGLAGPSMFDEHTLRNGQNEMNGFDEMQQSRPPPARMLQQQHQLQNQAQNQNRGAHQHQQQQQQSQQHQQQQLQQTAPRQGYPMNHMPPMQMPPMNPANGMPRLEYMQNPPLGYSQPPPPGFATHAPRLPPGFHGMPNMFQPREGAGPGMANAPPIVPPGFFPGPPQGNMPPGLFLGPRPNGENVPGGMGVGGMNAGANRAGYGLDALGQGR